MENPSENIHEMHEGKAWMKGNLYKLNVMDVENYYDGKNIYTYMPEVNEEGEGTTELGVAHLK